MWLMLQQDSPDDYVIATGKMASVRDFIVKCAAYMGLGIRFEGEGTAEKGIIETIDNALFESRVNAAQQHLKTGQCIVEVDPFYFRPTEVELLIGDASKAREKLGWQCKYDLDMLISEIWPTT
jgi:GDPmannose 4,6-dehydratase